jgi:hypothetical protein
MIVIITIFNIIVRIITTVTNIIISPFLLTIITIITIITGSLGQESSRRLREELPRQKSVSSREVAREDMTSSVTSSEKVMMMTRTTEVSEKTCPAEVSNNTSLFHFIELL